MPKPKPASLQFGEPDPALKYRDRPTAYGVAERRGQIALICVTREGQEPYYDLPGGEIEPGESEGRALAREFAEETGLVVHAGEILALADQYMVKKDGEPVANRGVLVTAVIDDYDPATKIEEDHKLVWRDPQEALLILRLDSQAWAVACWLRRRERDSKGEAA